MKPFVKVLILAAVLSISLSKAAKADGGPIVPVANLSYERNVASGPFQAVIVGDNLELSYLGILKGQAAEVGVIQGGNVVGYFVLTEYRTASSAMVPTRLLRPGVIQLFVLSRTGKYDSNFSRNYEFRMP
jgi:hypothetical protein